MNCLNRFICFIFSFFYFILLNTWSQATPRVAVLELHNQSDLSEQKIKELSRSLYSGLNEYGDLNMVSFPYLDQLLLIILAKHPNSEIAANC